MPELIEKFKTGNCNDCKTDIIVSRMKYVRRNISGEYFEEVLENRGSIVKVHSSKYVLVCNTCFDNKYSKNYKNLGIVSPAGK